MELETWVLGFGPDAEVIAPDHFAARIGGQLQKAARRYEERGE